jgi:hypothetical protein
MGAKVRKTGHRFSFFIFGKTILKNGYDHSEKY